MNRIGSRAELTGRGSHEALIPSATVSGRPYTLRQALFSRRRHAARRSVRSDFSSLNLTHLLVLRCCPISLVDPNIKNSNITLTSLYE